MTINLRDPAIKEIPRTKWIRNTKDYTGDATYGTADIWVTAGHFFIVDSILVSNGGASNTEVKLAAWSVQDNGGASPKDTAPFLDDFYGTPTFWGINYGGMNIVHQDLAPLTHIYICSRENPIYMDEGHMLKVWGETDENLDVTYSWRDFF